jgi:hypothetical protein
MSENGELLQNQHLQKSIKTKDFKWPRMNTYKKHTVAPFQSQIVVPLYIAR